VAGSSLAVLKACGHFMMVERPDETLEALKAVA
jgi:pimeloyl-ACP methyl ester carboxylesterase